NCDNCYWTPRSSADYVRDKTCSSGLTSIKSSSTTGLSGSSFEIVSTRDGPKADIYSACAAERTAGSVCFNQCSAANGRAACTAGRADSGRTATAASSGCKQADRPYSATSASSSNDCSAARTTS